MNAMPNHKTLGHTQQATASTRPSLADLLVAERTAMMALSYNTPQPHSPEFAELWDAAGEARDRFLRTRAASLTDLHVRLEELHRVLVEQEEIGESDTMLLVEAAINDVLALR